ncbi:imidazole glycerol phosphate synthase subunit HisH [Caldibacillus lycopersici]|uniref:Imidazole glycerol phosphate synthase subunit HisH n=1 Tax=Perspicuibacillus lycopersici TaxID=1325689 RepID=A0AAE3IUS7_9BACI|nr:imidazole glycerol phosphate synthase subunit HisH [Perspicuibacillus lycopersici]MCU9613791.1 imidazole glycerol phosphate synthase subunit HisH [Perspicuibacillus lycopersici]
MIAIIDYGAGNLKSVQHALTTLGLASEITADPEKLYQAAALILPGVGAFQNAMVELNRLGLVAAIKENAKLGKPILGICLGLQLLYEKSYEQGEWGGLGLLSGEVIRFNTEWKVPHMGWNNLIKGTESAFGREITADDYVYFVHSYYVDTKNPEEVLFWSDYGCKFPAVVKKDNIIGIQFHPEKSGETGMKLLKSFGEMML